MRRQLQGSFTIEAALIVPILLMFFSMIFSMLFYYHDKNVVAALAHETLVKGCGQEEMTAEEMEQYMQKRIKNKLVLFGHVETEIVVEGESIVLTCRARKRGISFQVQQQIKRIDPEQKIWNIRYINRIKEGVIN